MQCKSGLGLQGHPFPALGMHLNVSVQSQIYISSLYAESCQIGILADGLNTAFCTIINNTQISQEVIHSCALLSCVTLRDFLCYAVPA